MYIRLRVDYPLFLSDFNETRIFSTDIRKILKEQITKVRLVETELFHADGSTDGRRHTKLIVTFQNICERAYKPAITESSKDKCCFPFR